MLKDIDGHTFCEDKYSKIQMATNFEKINIERYRWPQILRRQILKVIDGHKFWEDKY